MTFNRSLSGDPASSGQTFTPLPGIFEHPSANADSHLPSPSDPAAVRRADIVCLSDIQPRPVEWLWQDRLESSKDGKLGAWYWSLPPAQEDQPAGQAAT
jgi:hypothetical protein